jgi:ABC-type phosphate transport system substrate-binding protein
MGLNRPDADSVGGEQNPSGDQSNGGSDLQITADAISLVRGSEVLDVLDKRPTTVGIVNVGTGLSERHNVKTVSIDGASPSPEAVQNGKYKFFNERGVVTLGAPQGAAKRFLEFVGGAEGQKILARHGVISAK